MHAAGTGAMAGAIGGMAGGALFSGLGGLGKSGEPVRTPAAEEPVGTAGPRPTESDPAGQVGKPGCNSFTPATPVLMADGSAKPIIDVKVGDKVATTDPKTGSDTNETVVKTFNNVDTDLTDLTVADATGKTSVINTTQHHPFWDATKSAWVMAGSLPIGDKLHTESNGTPPTVVAVANFTGASMMLDLTVNRVHTFYVVAGATPVLVHNCGNVDYFDPDNDLLNAVHNQRLADKNRGSNYAAARYRDADGNEQIAVMHSDQNGHAEQHLVNSLGQENILEVYSEFQPCQRTCTPLLKEIPTSWSWDWTTSAAGREAQAARRQAVDILFETFGG
jgi:hypothetical protein